MIPCKLQTVGLSMVEPGEALECSGLLLLPLSPSPFLSNPLSLILSLFVYLSLTLLILSIIYLHLCRSVYVSFSLCAFSLCLSQSLSVFLCFLYSSFCLCLSLCLLLSLLSLALSLLPSLPTYPLLSSF